MNYIALAVKTAVLATTKVPNLKANHNLSTPLCVSCNTTKVPNLKANHNR